MDNNNNKEEQLPYREGGIRQPIAQPNTIKYTRVTVRDIRQLARRLHFVNFDGIINKDGDIK